MGNSKLPICRSRLALPVTVADSCNAGAATIADPADDATEVSGVTVVVGATVVSVVTVVVGTSVVAGAGAAAMD